MIEEERMAESQVATLKVRTMRPTTIPTVDREVRKTVSTTRPNVKIEPTPQLSQINHQE